MNDTDIQYKDGIAGVDGHYGWKQVYRLMNVSADVERGESHL